MTIAERYLSTLMQIVSEHADPAPVVAASAGCDSNSLLLALVEQGKRPHVFSFTLADRRSRDSVAAEKNAATLGLPFHLVTLPATPLRLGAMARRTSDAGVRGKANIEALTPLRALIKRTHELGHRTIWLGLLADNHFGVSRSEIIKYRKAPVDTFDTHRRSYFATKGRAQVDALRSYGDEHGVNVAIPHYDLRMREVFLGKSWLELNKPRQKEAIRLTPGLDRLDVDRVRSNLQLGDSGVSETLARLVDFPEVNPNGHRSVVAVYNDWARNSRPDAGAESSPWCEDCGARLDVMTLCPSCLPNSERMPDEVVA